jgi:hypothetical protein
MNSPEVDPTYYIQRLVDKLIFFTNTRLDIAFAINLALIGFTNVDWEEI